MKAANRITPSTIAIVGGGLSGSLTAIQLLRLADSNLDIHLIERTGVFGRGVAYGTEEYSALLNVPAGKMSAFPDEPKHFLRWLQSIDFRTKDGQAAVETSFIPRSVYGRYIAEILDTVEQEAKVGVNLIRHDDLVVDIEVQTDEALLCLESGSQIRADKVVIAVGNFPPRDLPVINTAVSADPRYIKNPWLAGAFDDILPDDKLLIIGTGLTMVDAALALETRGHRGTIFAVSKHGLLPQPHRLLATTVSAPNIADLPNTARALVRSIRQQIETAAQTEGIDWRSVCDSLRSITPALWHRLPLNEKRRLLRHVQPYWDTHRHRMPPEAAAVIDHVQAVGQLIIRRGCIQGLELHDETVRVNIETQCQTWSVDVQYVINCTGPNTNYSTISDPLMVKLIQRRLAQPDCLKLGLDADSNGALRNPFGTASTTLYTIGSPLKGILWETTAVPEIRQQASTLSNTLLASLTVSEPVLTESY